LDSPQRRSPVHQRDHAHGGRTGVLKLRRDGQERRAGEYESFRDGLESEFRERILPVDVPVALAIARIGEAVRPMVIEVFDLIIAATARVHGLTVLTRNLRHFAPTGVPVLDPLAALPPDAR
jgi:hypothetical protein